MILSIAAHKGGVGKTTTALGLAGAFAQAGREVLVVDLDPQGHATLGLGIDPAEGPTVRELLSDAAWPWQDVAREVRPGLRVVPADIRLERAVQWLYGRPRRDQLLSTILARGPVPEVVLLDCPPSLGPLTEGALVAATAVLVPCRLEARASDGLVDLLELLSLLRGGDFGDWRIVLTQIDARTRVTNEAVRAALRPWAAKIAPAEIPKSEPLNQAQIARQDILEFAEASAGAQAYRALAAWLWSWQRNGEDLYGSKTHARRTARTGPRERAATPRGSMDRSSPRPSV